MKAVAFIVLAFVLQLNAQVQPESHRLVVYGEGIADFQANEARTSFTVVGFGPSMLEAMTSAKAKLSAVSKKLFAIGLTEKNLYTGSFYSGDNSQGKAFLSSSRDYRTQMDVFIVIDSLAWIDPVVTTLAGSEIQRLSTITFSLRGDSLVRAQVRAQAVANAQEKAQSMASQLGIELGKVIYLEEIFGLPTSPVGGQYFKVDGATTNTISLGGQVAYFGGQRFTVRSFIKAVFEIK